MRAIKIHLFENHYEIRKPLNTSSGLINHKKEILLLLSFKKNHFLILEIPLSPSGYETYEEIKFALSKNPLISRHINNALSYYANMSVTTCNLKKTPKRIVKIETTDYYDFYKNKNKYRQLSQTTLIKIKCSPYNLEDLCETIQKLSFADRCILDFNRSLKKNDIDFIIQHLKRTIYCLEEPCLPAYLPTLKTRFPSIYADETLCEITYNNLIHHGYTGFVYKGFKNSFSDLVLCNLNKCNLDGYIGWNLSGPFDKHFSALLNERLPTKIFSLPLWGDYKNHPLENVHSLYKSSNGCITSTEESLNYLYSHCKLTGHATLNI